MRKRLTIFAFLGALLLGWPSVVENQQSHPHTKSDKGAQAQNPVPPTHVIVDPSPAIEHLKANDVEKAPEEKPLPRFERPEWVAIYITAFYVLIAGVTLRVIWKQASIMQEQARDNRKSTAGAATTAQATLDAIKQQADAADAQIVVLKAQAAQMVSQTEILEKSVAVAQKAAEAALLNAQALIKSERAWILVDLEWPNSSKPTQTINPTSGEPITSVPFLLRSFNEGKTPCWITEKRLCAQIVDTIPEKPEMEKLKAKWTWTGVEPVRVGKEASPWDGATGVLGHLRDDQMLIIWGVVTYRDAFNENLETFWGYFYKPSTSGPYLHRIPDSAYNWLT